ncbi:MAG: hypothetical protein KDC00_04500 [Flavobacteriales bacterium]|nr:hypothetical protein [Flavobacteriales bacterium]
MKHYRTWTFCTIILLMLSCAKDDDDVGLNPTIDFRTDTGYTYLSDTVGTQDTMVVGVLVSRGDDRMHHFKVTVSYDGGQAVDVDSIPLGSDTFEFDKVIVTRDMTGSERWGFVVVENDGDILRRSLTFTVE